MKKGMGFPGMLLFLLLGALAPFAAMAEDIPANCRIEGVIRDSMTGLPIAGMLVRATEMSSRYYQEAYSGTAGEYAIPKLRLGSYRVEVFAVGDYIRTYYGDVVSASQATLVHIITCCPTLGIDINVIVSGRITGCVFRATDLQRLSQIPVIAVSEQGMRYSTESKTTGFYSIEGLPPGRYKVNADPPSTMNLFGQYYDRVYTPTEATWVYVRSRETTPDIHFILPPGGTISGVIRHCWQDDCCNTTVPNIRVHLYQNGRLVQWTVSNDKGEYRFVRLTTDTYFVEAVPENQSDYLDTYYKDAIDLAGAAPVHVEMQQDTRDIDIHLVAGGIIKGKITRFSNGKPVQNVTVSALTASGVVAGFTVTDKNGLYTINRLLPGSYIVRAEPLEESNLIRMYFPNADRLDRSRPVPVQTSMCLCEQGTTTKDIDFVLRDGGQITGTIRDIHNGVWLPGIPVVASTGRGETYSGRSDMDGFYAIKGLPSGQYKVFIDPDSGQTTGYLPEYYDKMLTLASATPLDIVAPGVTSSIDFILTRGGIIAGRVTRFSDGEPVEGMEVIAEGSSRTRFSGVTEADGTYRIIGLPADRYLVIADSGSTGFVSVYYNDVFSDDEASRIEVAARQTVTDIDFRVSEGGKISGVVIRDPNCRPLPCRDVCDHQCRDKEGSALDQCKTECETTCRDRCETQCADQPDGQRRTQCIDQCMAQLPPYDLFFDVCGFPIHGMLVIARGSHGRIGQVYTDEDGYYEIGGLVPGAYTVEIEPSPSSDYLKSYYQNVPDVTSATSVDVSRLQTTPNIDFHAIRGGKISGTVYYQPSSESVRQPVGNIRVTALSSQGKEYYAFSRENGDYLITGLPTGAYTVRVTPEKTTGYLPDSYEGGTLYIQLDPNDSGWNVFERHVDFPLTRGGRITGVVRRLVDRKAIPGMTVKAVCESGEPVETISAADGSYVLSPLPAGNYVVWIEPNVGEDYVAMYYRQAFEKKDVTPVSVAVEETVSGIDFDAPRGGRISGLVFHEITGDPIAGIKVEAESVIGGIMRHAFSNEDGTYSISGLRGQYIVYIKRDSQANFIPEYYNNAFDEKFATHVIVEEERVYLGIDFGLNYGGAASGRVVRASDGKPVQNAVVRATTVTGDLVFRETLTDENGHYLLEGLENEKYILSATPPLDSNLLTVYYPETVKKSDATPFWALLNEQNNGIDFTLPVGGRITGRVFHGQNNASIPNMKMEIKAIYGNEVRYVETEPDGLYEFAGLSDGKYTVRIDPDKTTGFLGVYYNNKPFRGDANIIRILNQNTRSGIDFRVVMGGIISGVIRHAGVPVPGIQIYVVHTASGEQFPAVYTDAEGRYRVIGLPTGQYTLHADPTVVKGYVGDYYTTTKETVILEEIEVEVEKTTTNINIALITDAPGRPVPILPADGSTDVSLTPELEVEPYRQAPAGPDENSEEQVRHASTQWQIAADVEFKDMVLDVQSEYFMEYLPVPTLVLRKLTVYYWRARFHDSLGRISNWSVPFFLETGAAEWAAVRHDGIWDETRTVQDDNGDGIPDEMEIDDTVDIDKNGVMDLEQDMIQCLFTENASAPFGLKWFSGGLELLGIRVTDIEYLPEHEDKPERMINGLISFKIASGNRVEVVAYLDKASPKSAAWYVYHPDNTWERLTDTVNAEMGAYDKFVILKLEDGGPGDIDGVKNGVIVHQGGMGVSKQVKGDGSSYDDNSRGCFTGVTARPEPVVLLTAFVGLLLAGILIHTIRRRS